ncbi:MAG: hypothetical protein UX85_C0003G0057 [Candidatus Beckwithbacteria bacterium GW2011_GWB1_47_15]|uniref:DUF3307 domain-containing protein n=1 Tax=Candidatus Beckwithbacteria bacterium GW2011_GWB1_47_15 TaxID=1618371 RepID=A0A0G1U4Z0_9BACT|nr:MAG: Uncharacterized protein UY43_C0001G0407 [Candidatus Beckwithbacteria bacterium GW2011_GWC1_49_16]KKU35303.1 MAG: hypothetical protein UX50_C0004G0034 [Candidatus Beckwithbacteria bacterium GW2011_GWA1_46_30]KKU61398.1 MAG: hypothetical protein UX85_C0003G0057 [Candidatus Beckwithbacteria bacterium GW2011_GWB1_47_15]KKU71805.1 MAG: hypothetical protein UX97_C0003G0034 [Candidatus Beckwithbacteria bacterium GW2011_GWA2_47_25]KKW03038.1 MAG: hypothetical protein UY37_C0008G0042 [Candidatus
MLDASHALIGASLAKLIPNPYLGLPASLAVHFLADLTPHWDFRTRKVKRSKAKIIFLSLSDAAAGMSLGYIIFADQVPLAYLVLMMFTAQLPDWIEAPYHVFDANFPPFSWVKRLQSRLHNKLDLPWGLVWQVVIVAIIVIWSLG